MPNYGWRYCVEVNGKSQIVLRFKHDGFPMTISAARAVVAEINRLITLIEESR